MGCYLKVVGQPFYLCRGQKVEEKERATHYLSAYSAETMQLRWEAAHKRQKLEIRRWDTNDVVDRTVRKAPLKFGVSRKC